MKDAKRVAVCWPRWLPCPYMVKTFKNLLLQDRGCLGAESLHKSSGTGGLPNLHWHLTFLWRSQACFPLHLYWPHASNCMGKMLRISNDLLWSLWANVVQISFGASLGQGNKRFDKMVAAHWPSWPPCPYMVKNLKIFFSRTEDAFGLNLCTNHRGQEVYQSC